MPAPYSEDLRRRAVTYYQEHEETQQAVARVFAIGSATLGRWLRRLNTTGTVTAQTCRCGRKGAMRAEDEMRVSEQLEQEPDARWVDLTAVVNAHRPEDPISRSTVGRALKRLGFTRKKKTFRAPQRDQDALQEECARWHESLLMRGPHRTIALDESACDVGLTPTYGRSVKGERVFDVRPSHPKERLSLIGAVTTDGEFLVKPVEGTVNRTVFEAFVRTDLAPYLRPDDGVFMDHARFHKVPEGMAAFQQLNVIQEFQPRYAPETNPLDLGIGAKFKQSLRRHKPKTLPQLHQAIDAARQQITPDDIKNSFWASGVWI